MEEPKDSEQPLQKENNGSASSLPDTDDDPHDSDDKNDPMPFILDQNHQHLR
jgi:hypothetical protein